MFESIVFGQLASIIQVHRQNGFSPRAIDCIYAGSAELKKCVLCKFHVVKFNVTGRVWTCWCWELILRCVCKYPSKPVDCFWEITMLGNIWHINNYWNRTTKFKFIITLGVLASDTLQVNIIRHRLCMHRFKTITLAIFATWSWLSILKPMHNFCNRWEKLQNNNYGGFWGIIMFQCFSKGNFWLLFANINVECHYWGVWLVRWDRE